MAIYRFRVTFEDHDDVSRDIEIRPTQTFEDLHIAIQEAIGFDAQHQAVFYLSDTNWKKGKEITSRELSEEEAGKVARMSKSRLCDLIADPHQKILYQYDLLNPWPFYIELIKILPKEDMIANYPRCVKEVNEAPKQYGNNVAAIPVPEDFDEELAEEEGEENEMEEEIMGTDAEDIPEGEDSSPGFVAGSDSDDEIEMETADEDLIDDESPENDEY